MMEPGFVSNAFLRAGIAVTSLQETKIPRSQKSVKKPRSQRADWRHEQVATCYLKRSCDYGHKRIGGRAHAHWFIGFLTFIVVRAIGPIRPMRLIGPMARALRT